MNPTELLRPFNVRAPRGIASEPTNTRRLLLPRKWGYRVRLNGEDHQWGKDPLTEVVG